MRVPDAVQRALTLVRPCHLQARCAAVPGPRLLSLKVNRLGVSSASLRAALRAGHAVRSLATHLNLHAEAPARSAGLEARRGTAAAALAYLQIQIVTYEQVTKVLGHRKAISLIGFEPA